jgi:hypothetical protein
VDISVLAQDANNSEVIRTGEVYVELVPRDRQHPPIFAHATFAAADNKLFRAAKVDFPGSGLWDVTIECRDSTTAEPVFISYTMDAGAALPNWLAIWPWFAWPLAAVALFLMHRKLVARHASKTRV